MMTIVDIFKSVYKFVGTIIKLLASLVGKEVDIPDISDIGNFFGGDDEETDPVSGE